MAGLPSAPRPPAPANPSMTFATRSALLIGVSCCMLFAQRSSAQATAYVTNLDPSYRDLDALIAAGLVQTAVSAIRPYSRLAMSRFTIEARKRLALKDGGLPPRFAAAVARLEEAFAAEIRALERAAPESRDATRADARCVVGKQSGPQGADVLRLRYGAVHRCGLESAVAEEPGTPHRGRRNARR